MTQTLHEDLNLNELSEKLSKLFTETNIEINHNQLMCSSDPFPHCLIQNFLTKSTLNHVKCQLNKLGFKSWNNDLYEMKQTEALDSISDGAIGELRQTLVNVMRPLLAKASGIELSPYVSLTGSLYEQSHYLLCHDDRLDQRCFAYVLYLTDDQWNDEDGGQLQLFSSWNNQPVAVTKSYCPIPNSLLIFAVSKRSFHQVCEVRSSKSRLSINGWFHRPAFVPVPLVTVDEQQLNLFVNPAYLKSDQLALVHHVLTEDSYTMLKDFLSPNVFNQLVSALNQHQSHQVFQQQSVPNRYCCRSVNVKSLNTFPRDLQVLSNLLMFFQSIIFHKFLQQLTGLTLVTTMEESLQETNGPTSSKLQKLSNQEAKGSLLSISVSRWLPGCYTLLANEKDSGASKTTLKRLHLDVVLFVGVKPNPWQETLGGFISYYDTAAPMLDRKASEELVRIVPEDNGLSLIVRPASTQSFVKYINHSASSGGAFAASSSSSTVASYFTLSAEFIDLDEVQPSSDSDSDSEGQSESASDT